MTDLPVVTDLPNEGVLLAEVTDRVATITLNRPEARNALNREVQRRLPELVSALDADPGVDVLILTGTDPAFSAGVDLKELGQGSTELVLPKEQRGPLPPRTKPLIGAINGVAITGGFELALACDVLIGSTSGRVSREAHVPVVVTRGAVRTSPPTKSEARGGCSPAAESRSSSRT